MKSGTKILRGAGLCAACWLLATCFCPIKAEAQVHVLTWHNDSRRTGQNLREIILRHSNVNTNTFGRLFSFSVDGQVYAQPLYVSNLRIPGVGVRNVVFIATQHNTVYAFDADSNAGDAGGLIWQVNLGSSAATPNPDFGNANGAYNDIIPEVGITGTPVIDLVSKTIYVAVFTHEGADYFHRLHALNIVDGSLRPNSPATVAASLPGTGVDSVNGVVTFNPRQQLQRAALTLAGGRVYVAYTGFADTPPYHGWLFGFDADTLELPAGYVFITTPNSTADGFGAPGKGGIWMSGAGPAADAFNNLFFITGNGAFDATNGLIGTEFGDSIIRLSTFQGLRVADFFTPLNQETLAVNNVDLGSGGAMLLPDGAASLAHPHLLVGAGKLGTIYLVDRDNLGRFNSSGNAVVQELPGALNGVWSSAAYFNQRIYYQGINDDDGMKAFRLFNGRLQPEPVSRSGQRFGYPGATPAISANGAFNAIIWALQNDGYSSGAPAILHAYDAADLSRELYSSAQAGDRDRAAGAVKFTVPTIANGRVYVGGQNAVTVFGLLDTSAPVFGGVYQGLFSDPAGVAHQSSGFIRATVNRNGRFTGMILSGGRRFPLSGRFDNGTWSGSVPRRNPAFDLDLELNSSRPEVLTGQVTGADWVADLAAYRAPVYSRADPAPQLGKYTMLLPGTDNSETQPGGDGYARLMVNPFGRLAMAGKLADGSVLQQSTRLSSQGEWDLYTPLYARNGCVQGRLTIENQAASDIQGQVTWIKLAGARPNLYPAGFTNQTEVVGSTFLFTRGTPILNIGTGQVLLENGDLPDSVSSQVTLGNNNRLTGVDGTALTIVPGSGLFLGRVADPDGSMIPVRGAVLQKLNTGSGFFVRSGRSGRVALEGL